MNRLQSLRKEQGLSQQALTDVLNDELGFTVTLRTLQNWETNRTPIKSEPAQILAEYFSVPVAYLLGFIEDREENLVGYNIEDEELIDKGREFVKMLVSDKSLEQFEELYRKQSGLPLITSTDSDGDSHSLDTSYIVHEKLTHLYWLIGVAPREYQEMLAKWSLLNYDEHDKIMGLINVLIASKID